MKKTKFFILVSGVHNFEKENYGTQIFVSHSYPWSIQVIKSDEHCSHGGRTFCESIAGRFVWLGCFTESGSPGQCWATRGPWCPSKGDCFWELVPLKCDQLKESSNHRKYNGAQKRPGQKMHIHNYLIVRRYIQFQKSVILTMTCWVVLESH